MADHASPRATSLGLMLANPANRHLLRRRLSAHYPVIELGNLTRSAFRRMQLLIIDGVYFAQHRSWLATMRQRGATQGVPVLLLSPRNSLEKMTAISDPFVDAIVHTPMAMSELLERIASLLRTQELAANNARLLCEAQAHIHQLKDERELRERVVSALGHDLRTPLTSARLHVERIVRGRVEPEAAQNLGRRVMRNIDRCDRMIRSLLDVSRISAGEPLEFDFHMVDLCALVREMLGEMSPSEAERFVVVQPARLEAEINGDGIRRTLENLLSNAIKYGTPCVPITLTLAEAGDGASITLQVHNAGSPIPAKDLPRLFASFSRAASAQSEDLGRSWGLGLGVVQGIVQAHDGQVSVQSTAAQGTTFTVTLPKARHSHLPPHRAFISG